MVQTDIETAIDLKVESSAVDYKACFDIRSTADWVEIIKDVVAIANSGGGVIIFGLNNDGTVGSFDCAELEALDPAVVTDKLYRYTGQQFRDFTFYKPQRNGHGLFALSIDGVEVPIVFSKPGTYDIGGGKQKTAFSSGTVYFRHGAKSEPANSDDLRVFIDNRIEKMRKAWFEGIVKVVEAPPGSEVQIVSSRSGQETGRARLVNDPSAPTYHQRSIDETHPHRQKEVVELFNKAAAGKTKIIPYDILCVRSVHNIDSDPNLCHKMKHSSSQFSDVFIDWLIARYGDNPNFFQETRSRFKELRQGPK